MLRCSHRCYWYGGGLRGLQNTTFKRAAELVESSSIYRSDYLKKFGVTSCERVSILIQLLLVTRGGAATIVDPLLGKYC